MLEITYHSACIMFQTDIPRTPRDSALGRISFRRERCGTHAANHTQNQIGLVSVCRRAGGAGSVNQNRPESRLPATGAPLRNHSNSMSAGWPCRATGPSDERRPRRKRRTFRASFSGRHGNRWSGPLSGGVRGGLCRRSGAWAVRERAQRRAEPPTATLSDQMDRTDRIRGSPLPVEAGKKAR